MSGAAHRPVVGLGLGGTAVGAVARQNGRTTAPAETRSADP